MNALLEVLNIIEAADDLIADKQLLRDHGLTEEEIEGYEEFFFDNYFPTKDENN